MSSSNLIPYKEPKIGYSCSVFDTQKSSCRYVKSVSTWSYSSPYFAAFRLNTETYSVNLHIQSKCVKIQIRKTPNTDTFYAISNLS